MENEGSNQNDEWRFCMDILSMTSIRFPFDSQWYCPKLEHVLELCLVFARLSI